MELESVLKFLENKFILVTGATGFLAKIFVEKVLRVQPNVKKVYLLLRAPDANAATQRLCNEIIGKDLFRVLKEKMGANFGSFIREKVSVMAGDITRDDLGVDDLNLKEDMFAHLDCIVNLAATTNFDERYDVSLFLNTLGAKNCINFAKKCIKLKVLIHVSTAYVSGEKGGLILENAYHMGESQNGVTGLDIDNEVRLVEEKLEKLQAQDSTHAETTFAMKDFGLQRLKPLFETHLPTSSFILGAARFIYTTVSNRVAKKYGWPNTYVFTKAMGEMLLEKYKQDMNVVIVRPTIVLGTHKEPFPGWVEGMRTIDNFVVGFGIGKLTCFLGDLDSVIDGIPADYVVNAIIMAMSAHAYQPNDNMIIYHVGSSVRNPFTYRHLYDYCFQYFSKKPWINKDGKLVRVSKLSLFEDMDSFHSYIDTRYVFFLKGLGLLNAAFCKLFQGKYAELNRKLKFMMRMVELFRPYIFFKGLFDDMNLEKLRMAAKESGIETDMFYFDPKSIDWEDYFMSVHIPGLVKYVFK